MARHSEWRGRASRVRPAFFAACVAGYATHLALVIGRSDEMMSFWMTPLVGVATFFGTRSILDRRARVRALAVGGDEDEIPVRVRYSRAAFHLGDDAGMLCLENGWLVFRGGLSDWSIRAADVRKGSGGRAADGDFLYGVDHHEVSVTGLSVADAARVRGTFDLWWLGPKPAGESTLPPVDPPPVDWLRTFGPSFGLMGMFGVAYAVFGFVAITKLGFLLVMPGLLPMLDGVRRRRPLPELRLGRRAPAMPEPSVRTERSLRDSA